MLLKKLRSFRARLSLLAISLVIVAGMLVSIGLSQVIDSTTTESFCISCHEMKATVYEEYKSSVHDINRAGIKVTCSDCHLSKRLLPKLKAKIFAIKDVYHHLIGSIDTPEKFEAHRLTMAKRVWAYLEESQSETCRGCHKIIAMDFEEQTGRAARKHKTMLTEGKSCIDCHKGIAHELPDGYEDEQESEGILTNIKKNQSKSAG